MKQNKYHAISKALRRLGKKIPLANAHAIIEVNTFIRRQRMMWRMVYGVDHGYEWWWVHVIDKIKEDAK